MPLALRGLRAALSATGELALRDVVTGDVVADAAPARMWDASLGANSDEPLVQGAVPVRLVQDTSGTALILTPDAAFFDQAGLVYPVTIDPTTNGLTKLTDTFVSKQFPATSYYTDVNLKVGTYNSGTDVDRSLGRIDPTPLAGDAILSGTYLDLWENWSWSCTPTTVELWSTNTDVTNSTTWNTAPTQANLYASTSAAKGYSSSCAAGWVRMQTGGSSGRTMATLVAAWLASGIHHGWEIKASSETDNFGWKKFDSDQGANPWIFHVAYDTPPVKPTIVAPAAASWVANTTTTLTANVSDVDPSSTEWPIFTVKQGATVIATVAGAHKSCTVPCASSATVALPDGAYTVTATTTDGVVDYAGTQVTSASTGVVAFTVDSTKPAVAVLSSSTSAGSMSLTWTALDVAAANGAIGTVTGYGVVVDQTSGTDAAAGVAVASATSASPYVVTPGSAGTWYVHVAAHDAARNFGPTAQASFVVVGAGLVTSPAEGSDTPATVVLLGTGAPGDQVRFLHRDVTTNGAWVDVPPAQVTLNGGSFAGWPVTVDATGKTPAGLVWNLAPTPGEDRLVEVETSVPAGFSPIVQFTLDQSSSGAASAGIGGGSVNLATGAFSLSASEGSVSRTFDTNDPATTGVFGPGWVSSFLAPSQPYTTLVNTGAAWVTNGSGQVIYQFGTQVAISVAGSDTPVLFAFPSSGSPALFKAQDANAGALTLSATRPTATGVFPVFTLVDEQGNTVTFGQPAGAPVTGTPPPFVPTSSVEGGPTGSAAARTASYAWDYPASGARLKVIGQPPGAGVTLPAGKTCADMAAPVVTGVVATPPALPLATYAGCRATALHYDASGRLDAVYEASSDTSTDPASALLAPTWQQVAAYTYDAAGRLSSTFDPRSRLVGGGTERITNGGFETNTTGWGTFAVGWPMNAGATITRQTTTPFIGTGVGRVVTTATPAYEGIGETLTGTFTAGTTYHLSLRVRGVSGLGTPVNLVIGGANTDNASPTNGLSGALTNLTGTWQEMTLDWTPAATFTTGVLAAVRTAGAYAATFDIDNASVTALVAPLTTTYAYTTTTPVGLVASVTTPGTLATTYAYTTTGRLVSANHGGIVSSVVYGVALSGSGLPTMTAGTGGVADWAQHDVPVSATAMFPPTQIPPSSSAAGVSDWTRAKIHYLDVNGNEVNTAEQGLIGATATWLVDTTEYDARGNEVRTLTAANRARALDIANYQPGGIDPASTTLRALALDSESVYSPLDTSTGAGGNLVDEYGPTTQYALVDGTPVTGRRHTHTTYDQSPAACAGALNAHLETTVTEGLVQVGQSTDTAGETRTTTASFDGQSCLGWTLQSPTSSTVDPEGLNITTRTVYDAATGRVLQSTQPAAEAAGGVGVSAHTTNTYYYTGSATAPTLGYLGASIPYPPVCLNAPAWDGLRCERTPAVQPTGTAGQLPVTTTTYDRANAVLDARSVVSGSLTATRTTSTRYDAFGRVVVERVAASGTSVGQAVSDTVHHYAAATGQPTTTTAETGGLVAVGDVYTAGVVGSTITLTYDTMGRVTGYTDAAGQATTSTYDSVGRLATESDGKGVTTYTYAPGEPRDLPTLIQDIQAGSGTLSIAGSYDADGAIVSENLPDGLTQTITTDPTGTTVTLASDAVSEQRLLSVHGQVITAATTVPGVAGPPNTNETYTYDAAGRLAQDAGVTSGLCTTRQYAYDADANRTALTTINAPDDSCLTSGGSTVSHTYDTADRLADTGYTYDALGRVTTVAPADSAGGVTGQTLGYYQNDRASTVGTSATTKDSYLLDPTMRTTSWTDTTGQAHVNHYADGTDSPSWTTESATTWTRTVVGLDGQVVALESPTGAAIQLPNLNGDIIATTAAATPTTTSLSDASVFGIPQPGTTQPRYGWLGALTRQTDPATGLTLMGQRLYNPNSGRFLQVDPIMGGSANDYDYCGADPINCTDLAGQNGIASDEQKKCGHLGGSARDRCERAWLRKQTTSWTWSGFVAISVSCLAGAFGGAEVLAATPQSLLLGAAIGCILSVAADHGGGGLSAAARCMGLGGVGAHLHRKLSDHLKYVRRAARLRGRLTLALIGCSLGTAHGG